ncbi:MAG: SDR family oxidoreductase [Verrucomicrobia bacterium]|nr:SDR family oxidoreductase [Verrucomicrobiota bacterium]
MRVLIIGCGYVGLPLGAELARQGHEVFGMRRTPAADGELRAAGIQPLHTDITDPASLAEIEPCFDWVANTVSSSRGGVEDYRRVYLAGTRNLVNWLMRAPPVKLVYTSSTGVYGQNDGSIVDESRPTEPGTETGRVLVETERLLLAAAREQGLPAVVLRLAGIYGPGRGHYFKQFVSGEMALADGGQRILNMIHRDDVVGAIIAALERGRAGEVYNVADDEPVTQTGFFRWLSAHLGRPMPSEGADVASASPKRHLTNKVVSNAKLKAELGCAFKYPTFREGYADEVARFSLPQR